MDERGTQSACKAAARCLLVVPRGYDAPLGLLDELRRQDTVIREVNDAPGAMVALAQQRFSVTILVEPQAIGQTDLLAKAIKKYHDGLPVWQHNRLNSPQLDRYVQKKSEAKSHKPVADRQDTEIEKTTHAAALSKEELAMLLGTDESDEPWGKSDAPDKPY